VRAESGVVADRSVPVAARGHADRRLAKNAESDDMFWLAPDAVPTLGDWLRAGGYRTCFKGKWHASHAHLDAEDGEGFLLSIDDDGMP
jgi:choline-sulfatase